MSRRVGQDFEVEVQARFWSWSLNLGRDSEAGFGQDFEFYICRWCFVEVMQLNLGQDSEAGFGQDFEA